ncbi:hypothetical protein C1N87_33305 (plasmid) [Priestia aryabhattai]
MGEVEFQQNNLNLPVREVNQEEFLETVFGHFKGHICVFLKRSDGRTSNTFYRHKEKERMFKYLQNTFGINTYVSYSTYYKKAKKHKDDVLRTQSNIVNTYMLVQDLDYYKLGMTDAECLQKIGKMVADGELICPTFIVSTGQGYQLIWLLEPFKNIAGYTNDLDWRRIQDHMYEQLKELNSDSVVKNPSAVTRLPGSKHNKTKNVVYGFLANEVKFTLQDFLWFYDIVPVSDRSVKPKKLNKKKATVTTIVKNWNEYTLNRQREEDIFIFVDVQNERGISYIGIRNWLALVLRFHALVSTNGDTEYAENRVKSLCETMDMTETTEKEILRRSKPAETYYKEWIEDTWDRVKYLRGGLFYTNARMLELMNIKEDYYVQWKMKTIKVKNNKYEAARKRFEKYSEEEAANHTWEAYQERRNEKITEEKEDKLWMLKKALEKHSDWNNKQLAEHLSISLATLKRWKSELNKSGKN